MQFKGSDSKPAVMYNVLYVPDLACNTLLDCTCDSVPPKEQANVACEQTADLWHQRLGHINEKYLTRMTKNEVVTVMRVRYLNCSKTSDLLFIK